MKSNGLRIEPWGTPHIIFDNSVLPVLFLYIYIKKEKEKRKKVK